MCSMFNEQIHPNKHSRRIACLKNDTGTMHDVRVGRTMETSKK